MMTHVKAGYHICTTCQAVLPSKAQLDAHEQEHSNGAARYNCQYCNKTFRSAVTQRNHTDKHRRDGDTPTSRSSGASTPVAGAGAAGRRRKSASASASAAAAAAAGARGKRASRAKAAAVMAAGPPSPAGGKRGPARQTSENMDGLLAAVSMVKDTGLSPKRAKSGALDYMELGFGGEALSFAAGGASLTPFHDDHYSAAESLISLPQKAPAAASKAHSKSGFHVSLPTGPGGSHVEPAAPMLGRGAAAPSAGAPAAATAAAAAAAAGGKKRAARFNLDLKGLASTSNTSSTVVPSAPQPESRRSQRAAFAVQE